MGIFPGALPEQATKAAGVGKAQRLAIIEHHINMVMGHRWLIRLDNPQTAGHTQMQDGGAIGKLQQNIFSPSFNRFNHLAFDQAGQVVGHWPAQAGLTYHQLFNGMSVYMGLNTPAGGFNFGQFRHGLNRHSRAGGNLVSLGSRLRGNDSLLNTNNNILGTKKPEQSRAF